MGSNYWNNFKPGSIPMFQGMNSFHPKAILVVVVWIMDTKKRFGKWNQGIKRYYSELQALLKSTTTLLSGAYWKYEIRLFPAQTPFSSPCASLPILPHAVGAVRIPEGRDAHNSWGIHQPQGKLWESYLLPQMYHPSHSAKDLYNPEAREAADFSTFFHLPPHLGPGAQGLRAQQMPIVRLLQVAEHVAHGGNAHQLSLCTAPGQAAQPLHTPGAQHRANHFTQKMSCARKSPKIDWKTNRS